MKLVINQCRAIQGAAVLAAIARDERQWYLIEGDGLGAVNADRRAWLYAHAAAALIPALDDGRPEPQYEDYNPEPIIEPTPIYVLQKPVIEFTRSPSVGASAHLPKVLVSKLDDETLSA
ncbi:MAG: hypothetical protein KGL39_35905 [Patescibacteria group bacterium]|nr:hypothetical protein [Patescibacteria group bacterium]